MKFLVVLGDPESQKQAGKSNVVSKYYPVEEIEQAKQEAERLSKAQGIPFYIMGTVAMCAPVEQPLEWTDLLNET